jgi:hypothetical protein
MSLLREIQDAAIDSNTELAVLLRKCKVLAARLGSPEFKQWVENELSGYSDIENLPSYRILRVHSKGHFAGPFQSGLRYADIPMSCIPEELHEHLSHSYFTQPVAAMESLIKDSTSGSLQESWNPDIVAIVGQNIYANMNCMQAWKVIPTSTMVATLDAVRNKILNFVLEIEAESPAAGEAPVNSNPVPQEKVHQIFNTYITGDVQNVATGSTNVKQKAIKNPESEKLFETLLKVLNESNADQKVSAELAATVEEMRSTQGTKDFKGHYQNFMSLLADHMQIFGPIVAPFLPTLTSLMP